MTFGSFLRLPSWTQLTIGLLAISCALWLAVDRFDFHPHPLRVVRKFIARLSAVPEPPVTRLSQLPSPPNGTHWLENAGLQVETEKGEPDEVIRLTATGSRNHDFVVDIPKMPSEAVFRFSAQVRPGPAADTKLMVEIRDVASNRGEVANHNKIYFDLRGSKVAATRGNPVSYGISPEADGWERIWVDQRTSDGTGVVLVQLLDNAFVEEFPSAGQQMMLRRLSIAPTPAP